MCITFSKGGKKKQTVNFYFWWRDPDRPRTRNRTGPGAEPDRLRTRTPDGVAPDDADTPDRGAAPDRGPPGYSLDKRDEQGGGALPGSKKRDLINDWYGYLGWTEIIEKICQVEEQNVTTIF